MSNTPKPQANTLDEILNIDNILAGTDAKLTEIGYEVLGENITEAKQATEELIANEVLKGKIDYILSLGWQDTNNRYVKEVIKDADDFAEQLKKGLSNE